jgi:hypothetical protein
MKNDIDKRITALKIMPRQNLKDEWENLYGRKPPKKIGRGLLIRSIAYRYQEEALGGLRAEIREKLAHLIEVYRIDPSKAFKQKNRLKCGTRLIRSWKGRLHEVMATENGFLYQGMEYRSLTEVAGKITGSHWSGLAFFGLKKGVKPAKVEIA